MVVTVQFTIRVSGWWYNHCYSINGNHQPPIVGKEMLFSEMKIHLKDCSGYMFEPRTVYKISNILLSTVNHYSAYTTYSNHNNTGMQLQSYHMFIYYSSSPLR